MGSVKWGLTPFTLDEGILAVEPLMGLVLVIIAIQMFLDALRLIGAING